MLTSSEAVNADARAGEHGSDNVRVQVTDDNSGYSERINVRAKDNLGKRYRLDSNIRVEFSPGQFELNDTFSLNLQADGAVKPDPHGAFDASGGTDANLQQGRTVSAGAFTVNGQLITVASGDSILSVIEKINASDSARRRPAGRRTASCSKLPARRRIWWMP